MSRSLNRLKEVSGMGRLIRRDGGNVALSIEAAAAISEAEQLLFLFLIVIKHTECVKMIY
jgi:hypothetical protein